LANIVEKNQNAYIAIEGQLRTYHSKADNTWRTTINAEKIIQQAEPSAN
jgi:hypothetical protein